ncbi:hypothetical protein BJV82DRAFT_623984 [Fennellomyces sp. T-0311]|nr:hypothetical protein BJV82DRAFT_623984 [Fennellomyces sp. T-0311]
MLSTSSHAANVAQSRPMPSPTNPLSDLIHTEKSYLETLRIIDSQIARIWMKQTLSAAPDFTELLKFVHDIQRVNKRFCTKLVKVASNPKAMRELGDVLMQWIEDMEIPYANFSRSYIRNLDKRNELANNPSIRHLLETLSASMNCNITLDSLFEAPVKRLHYYKALYHRLYESTKPGRPDHQLLLNANQRIDTLIHLSQNDTPVVKSLPALHDDSHRQQVRIRQQQRQQQEQVRRAEQEKLPPIKCDPKVLAAFTDQVDCSRVLDFYSRTRIRYVLKWQAPDTQLIMQDSFILLPQHKDEVPTRVRLALTTTELAICKEMDGPEHRQKYSLMFTPLAVRDILVKPISMERAGEHLFQFTVGGRSHLVFKAESSQVRNAWIGGSSNSPRPFFTVVSHRVTELHNEQLLYRDSGVTEQEEEEASKEDIYALYSTADDDHVDHEPDSLPRARREAFRDTIMDFYDGRFDDDDDDKPILPSRADAKKQDNDITDSDGQSLADIVPRSVKILSRIPDPSTVKAAVAPPPAVPAVPPIPTDDEKKDDNNSASKMESAPVQMTMIQPAMHKMTISSMVTTSPEDELDSSENKSLPPSPQQSSSEKTTTTAPILPRSTSPGAAAVRQPPRNNTNPPSQINGGGIQSVRAALAASVDSFPESARSSEYSFTRGSASTAATEGGSPSSTEQPKPPAMTPPPRKGSMPENVVKNDNSSIPLFPPTPLPRTSSARKDVAPVRTTSIRQNGSQPVQSASTPVARQRQKPSLRLPARLDSHKTPSSSLEELASPPQSPGAYANATRQILYSHGRCEVFHWKNQSWHSPQDQCAINVRTTNANRSCLSIQLLGSGQLYLNAWILPTTVIELQGETDVSISVFMGPQKENYLVHFQRRPDAVELHSVLQRVHYESTQIFGPNGPDLARGNSQRSIATATSTAAPSLRSSPSVLHSVSLFDNPMPTDSKSYLEQVPQTLSPLMQCRCKLFSQQEHSTWNNMGSVTLRISQQMPSKKTHVYMENGKYKLISAVVMSSNVQRINPKRVSFLLTNEQTRTSMVYMVHLKDEKTADKIFEYVRTKNAQNGW